MVDLMLVQPLYWSSGPLDGGAKPTLFPVVLVQLLEVQPLRVRVLRPSTWWIVVRSTRQVYSLLSWEGLQQGMEKRSTLRVALGSWRCAPF